MTSRWLLVAARRAVRNKVELCLTSTYASWANPIEAQFGPLRTFVIAGSNHPNHPALTRLLRTCAGATPAPATPTSWAAQRHERAASAANDNDDGASQLPRAA